MATQSNTWQLGTMYGGGIAASGLPFYQQPDGPFTAVFPTESHGEPWAAWPAAGEVPLQEYNPWWAPGCGHSIRFWKIIREFDYERGLSCALVTCSHCQYVQNVIYDFEEWLNPQQYAIIVG